MRPEISIPHRARYTGRGVPGSRRMANSSILVVEDEADARSAMIDILELCGYSAVPAANGKEALDYLRNSPSLPSLIILDLLMPEMDGWQFRSEQVKDPDLAAVPVVVVTAFGGANIEANEILIKPVDVDRLLNIVHEYVKPENSV